MQECQPQAAAAKSFFFTQPQVEMANFWHIAMVYFSHLDTFKQIVALSVVFIIWEQASTFSCLEAIVG